MRIEWRERDGPFVAPVERMLERLLGPESAGNVTITFEPTGVVCVFDVDLEEVEKRVVLQEPGGQKPDSPGSSSR